ncbi:DUF4350 domain-containing protein [Curtobacterium sp. MCPF17_002]|uniref:DUF4350 domain-containing protein n=1 Tax=Curtobacterium sp. MCPF17_002 TaxID=2175645 RepID=UPI000DA99F9C|nr:DUF4350 domain-containing protein [Curtobacterium sp. MCPF17_002]WIB76325.1 DUF4350 domain-containing protein [Curtobacterium sp. MCPF17_002]
MTATATRPAERATVPPRDGRGLRIGFWVAIVLVGLLLAALTAVVQGSEGPSNAPLDPTSTTASGSKALVRVLEQQGTDVRVVDSADGITGGTVFVDDSQGALDPAVARRLARQASHVVLVSTGAVALDAFDLDVEPAGSVAGTDTVSTRTCAIPAAADARRVTTTGSAYRVPEGESVPDGTAVCAPSGSGDDRAYGLVRTATPGGDVTLVGTTSAFRNDTITTAGNAALALGLLGGDDSLTWYTPTPGTPDAAPTLGSLAPPWVPSALALLALVAVAAGVWRGRRLGPLVVEQMPVVVRAAETTEGRARLAARTRDRTHALDTLRVAALRRIGRRLGLPRSAHVDEVVRAAARATGIPDARVGAVLVGGTTPDHRALVAGAAALDDLERAVTAATTGDQQTDHDRRGARP